MVKAAVGVAESKYFQRRVGLEIVNELVEVIGQSSYRTSKGLAMILSCWNNIIMRRLNEFGELRYTATYLPTVIAIDSKL